MQDTAEPTSAANQPVRIDVDRAAGSFEIEWRDGHVTRYDTVALRWLCPCAYCRGEAGIPGYLDSRPQLSAEQTRLVDAHLVGQYAIAPTWGDGHHTGYYTLPAAAGPAVRAPSAPRCATTRTHAHGSAELDA